MKSPAPRPWRQEHGLDKGLSFVPTLEFLLRSRSLLQCNLDRQTRYGRPRVFKLVICSLPYVILENSEQSRLPGVTISTPSTAGNRRKDFYERKQKETARHSRPIS